MSNELSAGFANPVVDAQACFRAVLDAMARPGRVHSVYGVLAPAPLCTATAAVLLTLVDQETPVWLDPAAAQVQGWIAFHTAAPAVLAAQAMFAVALSLPNLAELPNGSDEMPETSATVILQTISLRTGRQFILEGPGLRKPKLLAIDGLPEDFTIIWQRNHSLFPRGVDLILCAGDELAALPRSTSIRKV